MIFQLRSYTVTEGAMDEWLAEWANVVYPLRRQFGFEVVGAWVSRAENRFVWIIGHTDFERRDRDYYESPARAGLDPDPARHLVATETLLMDEVSGV
ncbi:MAG: NIPSNAP family protein [Actinomycetota bacterium]